MAKAVKRLNIAISQEVLDYFKEKAEKSGQSLSAVVGLALLEYMEGKLSEVSK